MKLQQVPRAHTASRNVNELYDEATGFGDRLADALARFGGSWTFIILFVGTLAFWLGLNSLQVLIAPLDPNPFILLNLALSCLAAVQAPVILMSLNRRAVRDRLAAEQDYAHRVRAELSLERLHEKLDDLRERQWLDLTQLQRYQIALLTQMLERGDGRAEDPARVGGPAERDPRTTSDEGRADADEEQPAINPSRVSARAPRRVRIVDGRRHLDHPDGTARCPATEP